MNYCEQIWIEACIEDREFEVTWSDRDHCRQILSQASPSLISILQAIRFLSRNKRLVPFIIHSLLNLSWGELRMTICSLHSLICGEGQEFIRNLLIVALDPALFPVPFDLIMWDLACGSLCVMQRIVSGELDTNIR
jgi:hypothetical protein